MTLVFPILAGGAVAVSVVALYKERSIAAAAATFLAIVVLVMTVTGRR
jgi:hypothetical protein